MECIIFACYSWEMALNVHLDTSFNKWRLEKTTIGTGKYNRKQTYVAYASDYLLNIQRVLLYFPVLKKCNFFSSTQIHLRKSVTNV
jgi:hypothetical protein